MANEVDVKFSADISGLLKGLQQASAEIQATNSTLRGGATQIAASFGAISAAYATGASQQVSVTKSSGDDALAIARVQEQAKVQIALNGVKAQEAALKSAAQMSLISRDDETAGLLAAEDERVAIQRRGLEAQLAKLKDEPVKYAEVQAQITELESQSADRRINIVNQANLKIFNDYKRSFEQIGSTVSSSIMGMIQGHENLRQAAQKVLVGIVQDFIQTRIRTVADTLAGIAEQTAGQIRGQQAQTAATQAGVAARNSAEQTGAAAGVAANASKMLGQLQADAGVVYGNVFAYLSPTLGPFAAAPAAAASALVLAKDALIGFDQGSWELPGDMIAQVHKGEMIVPAAQTPWAQSLMANAAGGDGGGGGDTHNHTHNWNVAVNSASNTNDIIQAIKDNAHDVGRTLARAMTSSGFRARPA